MQEPLDNLSEDAQIVHADLEAHAEETRPLEAIVDSLGGRLRPGEVADALRELQAAQRASETFGGWSILT
jgi:hypothetical protein